LAATPPKSSNLSCIGYDYPGSAPYKVLFAENLSSALLSRGTDHYLDLQCQDTEKHIICDELQKEEKHNVYRIVMSKDLTQAEGYLMSKRGEVYIFSLTCRY
jgi:hypothetical protein